MCIKFRLTVIFVVLTLFACTDTTPSAPMCRAVAQPTHTEKSAACIIKVQDKVVLIGHRLSGRLDFPGGGRNNDEALPCTAHREVWEETGFNVLVGPKLTVTDNGMALFACQGGEDLANLPTTFSPPAWAKVEVEYLKKVDPFLISHNALRFSEDLLPLRDGFTAHTMKEHNP